MARTVYYVAASLDGFITEAPTADASGFDGQNADGPGTGAQHVGELSPGFDLAGLGALVMGAETYRSLQDRTPGVWEFGAIPAWIFTHHEFPGIPGADITFVRGDVDEFYPDIVHDAGAKDIGVIGGGNLAAQFLDAGLLDSMVLTLVPVALGAGRPVLPVANATEHAVLSGSRAHGQGLLELHYSFARE